MALWLKATIPKTTFIYDSWWAPPKSHLMSMKELVWEHKEYYWIRFIKTKLSDEN